MRIRLIGPSDEMPAAVEQLRQVFDVRTVSRPYSTRPGDSQDASWVRVYIDAVVPQRRLRLRYEHDDEPGGGGG